MAKTSKSPARMQRQRTAGNRDDNADVASGIWVVHAMHDRRRIPLLGDLRHEHFYFTEGDQSVDRSEYIVEPVKTTLDGPKDEPVVFDAVVTKEDGSIECRLVRSRRLDLTDGAESAIRERHVAAARRLGGVLVEVITADLDAAQMRIWNWVRVLGAYHRADGHSLTMATASIQGRLCSGRVWTIGDLLDAHVADAPAIVTAAIARLLRERLLASDLDTASWCRHTRIWWKPHDEIH